MVGSDCAGGKVVREGLCEEVSLERIKSARGTFGAQPAGDRAGA